jgi:hypothetical protein
MKIISRNVFFSQEKFPKYFHLYKNDHLNASYEKHFEGLFLTVFHCIFDGI